MKRGIWVEALRLLPSPRENGSTESSGECREALQWFRDPLSHPDLAAMTVTQLADLPFEPRRFSRE
jgi:hypothetical protein